MSRNGTQLDNEVQGRRRVPRRPLVGFLAALVAVLLTVAACSDEAPAVTLGAAGRADVVEVVDAPATVTARAAPTLTAPADGTLASLAVSTGDSVTPGQVLAVIDSPSAQQRLAEAAEALRALRGSGGAGASTRDLAAAQRRTDEAAAKAFASAREAANRIAEPQLREALLNQTGAAEAAYREAAAPARAVIDSVQRGLASVAHAMNALTAAQRAQAKAAYELAQSTVDALTLRAPAAGVVQLGGPAGAGTPSLTDLLGPATAAGGGAGAGAASAVAQSGARPTGGQSAPGIDPAPAVGAKVTAGMTIMTVVDTSELGLLAEVDETDVLLVTAGVNASIELDAAPGARYAAKVRSVDLLPSASPQGGVSYRARLTLGEGKFANGRAAPLPRPGMNAVAHLEVRSATSAVVVPAAAIVNANGRDTVWVIRGGRAEQASVTLGVAGAGLVQVVSGVAEGDRIVIRGTDRVRVGQELR
jgi:multidrug efflux pump subunit AcrA (membrane-fusion protein)